MIPQNQVDVLLTVAAQPIVRTVIKPVAVLCLPRSVCESFPNNTSPSDRRRWDRKRARLLR